MRNKALAVPDVRCPRVSSVCNTSYTADLFRGDRCRRRSSFRKVFLSIPCFTFTTLYGDTAAIFVWVSGFLHFYVSCLQSVTATVTHLTVTTTLKWIRREEVWMSTATTEGEESASTVR